MDEAIDYQSGDRVRGGKGFIEHFRLGPDDKFHDTQYQVLSGRASDDERGAKAKDARTNGEAKRTAHRYANQARQPREYWQGREYYDSWQQPFGRGQESNYRW